MEYKIKEFKAAKVIGVTLISYTLYIVEDQGI